MSAGLSRPLGKSITCPNCNTKIDNEPLQILHSKLLIVEGKDDEEFFKALLKELQIKDIQVAGIGGATMLRSQLKALAIELQLSRVRVVSMGIVRDADTNPKDAFQSVKDALSAAGFPSPVRPLNFVKGPPKVGIMIIPSHQQQGALEDLCLQAIANDPVMTCVAQYFDCIVKQGLIKPKEKELSKAKVQAFLSSREEPTSALGIAAQKGYWPLDNNAFKTVRKFLQAL
jgi:hypothetical protein